VVTLGYLLDWAGPEVDGGRKLGRALVRNGHCRPHTLARLWQHDRRRRELAVQGRGRGAPEGKGIGAGRAPRQAAGVR
jgi:hypothetical protein